MSVNLIRPMLTKAWDNYKLILTSILIASINVLGCTPDENNTPIMGRVIFLDSDGIVEIELYNWSDHEKLTTGLFGIGASTFIAQSNSSKNINAESQEYLRLQVKKIEEDQVCLVIIDEKNKIHKPILETDIVTKKSQLPNKSEIIKTITNLPNKGSLSLDTNILLK